MLTYPNIENQSPNDRNRLPLTGTLDEIGRDIQRIKDIGVDHIVFAYNCTNRKRSRQGYGHNKTAF